MALDEAKVLAHLDRWQKHKNTVVAAIADGLVARIEAGDMDEREEES